MIARRKPVVIDLFCGAGGESAGLTQAFEHNDIECELFAVNHWELALETHGFNHPTAKHYQEDVFKGSFQRDLPGNHVSLLWASPECTHHSIAAGGRPKNDQSRAGANSVLKWCSELVVDRVVLENVKEWVHWGELDANDKPIPERKGKLFEEWWAKLEKLGYTVEKRVLCAADFGAPTSRERLFVQAVRKKSGKKIIWPRPLLDPANWIPASAVIDWSDLGTPLHERKRPLCDATLNRIEKGIRKHWGEYAEPYIAILRGMSTTRSIHLPLPTLTTGQHMALVCPIDNRSTKGGCASAETPLTTITTKQRHSVAFPLVMGKHSNSKAHEAHTQPVPTLSTQSAPQVINPLVVGQHSGSQAHDATGRPVPTITTVPQVRLITPLIDKFYGTGVPASTHEPLHTITTKGRFGLVTPGVQYEQLAIGYRMLHVRELSAATGFDTGYRFAGNKTQTVKQIGNAVPPPLAYHQVLPYIEEFKKELMNT